MTLFQLILLVATGTIFYLFFKQLFGSNYPKRGVDFEANVPEEQIGGLMQPERTFSRPAVSGSRIDELIHMADTAAEQGDWLEVKKAMQSAQILDGDNVDVLRRLATSLMHMHDHGEAKKIYESILAKYPEDDLAEVSLANAFHKLGDDDAAMVHHQRAIDLDPAYAPHYYNYANTLYDLGRKDEARARYQKALEIDPEMTEAQKMIKELKRDDQ